MREVLTRSQKIARNKLDKRINAVVMQRCSGMTINIMDIPKVFAAGYEAAHAGEDVEAAVFEAYQQLSAKTAAL